MPTKYISGNAALAATLKEWGIKQAYGVTGGGICHLLKFFDPDQPTETAPQFITISEYIAGFCPIGHYLHNHSLATAVATTGAPVKLLNAGMSAARFMGIPALYIISLNNTQDQYRYPMQDVSSNGTNIIQSLKSEFSEHVFPVETINELPEQLSGIANNLKNKKPAILLFRPDALTRPISMSSIALSSQALPTQHTMINRLSDQLSLQIQHKNKIIIYVCSEAGYQHDLSNMIIELSERLQSPVVCSTNGLNALKHDWPLHYGTIGLGGSEQAQTLWDSINDNDLLLCIGLDCGEYEFQCRTINVKSTWILSSATNDYVYQDDRYQAHFSHKAKLVAGDIKAHLRLLIEQLKSHNIKIKEHVIQNITPRNPAYQSIPSKDNCVCPYELLNALGSLWPKDSIAFDDTCTFYRDRPHIMEIAHPNVRWFNESHGSSMGSAFGLAVGAKYACPQQAVFLFSGDGCLRYFSGSMAETADLGIIVFIINNKHYALVKNVMDIILENEPAKEAHTELNDIHYHKLAGAYGWQYATLQDDLSNLEKIFNEALESETSTLIIVDVDPDRVIGHNPRTNNLDKRYYR